jgi:hypothetical protein
VAAHHTAALAAATRGKTEARLLMIRIAVSLTAYQAIAPTMPEGRTARPPEPLRVGEGVGLWIDHVTLAALRRERRAGEG